MRVGFTGTRHGLTPAQGGALARLVRDAAVTEFHHGCCRGADAEAVRHVRRYHPAADIVGHQPETTALVANPAVWASNRLVDPLPYLERNRGIVDGCEVLVACPEGPEVLRSGTWSTVRYARRAGVPVVVVWPDGTVLGAMPVWTGGEG